jgi:hypothetical protein
VTSREVLCVAEMTSASSGVPTSADSSTGAGPQETFSQMMLWTERRDNLLNLPRRQVGSMSIAFAYSSLKTGPLSHPSSVFVTFEDQSGFSVIKDGKGTRCFVPRGMVVQKSGNNHSHGSVETIGGLDAVFYA